MRSLASDLDRGSVGGGGPPGRPEGCQAVGAIPVAAACAWRLIVAMLGVWLAATAQEAAPEPGPGPGPAAAVATGAGPESEAETIAKGLADLASPEVARRRRAVLVLGKYRAPAAQEGVLRALGDTDPEVRRSALVAMAEWEVLPAAATDEMVRLLRDDSVPVRRVASSLLADALGGLGGLSGGLSRGLVIVGGEVMTVRRPAALPEAVGASLNQALADPDTTVRRNVLAAARYLPGALRLEALEPCLRDPDREVRILALEAVLQARDDEGQRAEALARAVTDVDVGVRRELARGLARLGRAGQPILERLVDDADPGVRARAVLEVVQLRHERGLEWLERAVADDAIPIDERRALVVYAGFYGEAGRPLLTRLRNERSPALRAEAIRGLGRLGMGVAGPDPGFLLAGLEDGALEVRRAAAQALTRWVSAPPNATPETAGWPTQEALGTLLGSPYADVRQLAVTLASAVPAPARLELLTEALLDDATAVRSEAILHLAMVGSDEAMALVARSLEDPDTEVVLAAVRALALRPSLTSRQALAAARERATGEPVKAAIEAALQAGAGGAPVRLRPLRWPQAPAPAPP